MPGALALVGTDAPTVQKSGISTAAPVK